MLIQTKLFIASLLLLLIGLLLVWLTATRQRLWSGILSAFFALLFLLPGAFFCWVGWPDPRFSAYRSFYGNIREGMTRTQVEKLLDIHYPANGPRGRPSIWENSPTSLNFFMNPEQSKEPNCEGISVSFENGIVVRKGYSPD